MARDHYCGSIRSMDTTKLNQDQELYSQYQYDITIICTRTRAHTLTPLTPASTLFTLWTASPTARDADRSGKWPQVEVKKNPIWTRTRMAGWPEDPNLSCREWALFVVFALSFFFSPCCFSYAHCSTRSDPEPIQPLSPFHKCQGAIDRQKDHARFAGTQRISHICRNKKKIQKTPGLLCRRQGKKKKKKINPLTAREERAGRER